MFSTQPLSIEDLVDGMQGTVPKALRPPPRATGDHLRARAAYAGDHLRARQAGDPVSYLLEVGDWVE